ncbi:MAG: copper amine oxidase N-terminal domain-containing protein [Armatimonadetes bacterium]|nr:copper amine oxidase N-terminal domain-containing protein [Armatimonadota bacterium]
MNQQPVMFTNVRPAQMQGRVFVPLRGVLEEMGATLIWDQETKTVVGMKGDRQFTLPIGSRIATVNGRATTLDVPAQVIRGTTMVPLRFVSEALGADVSWSGREQRVEIVTEERFAGNTQDRRGSADDNDRTIVLDGDRAVIINDRGERVIRDGRDDRVINDNRNPRAVDPVIQSFRHLTRGPVKAGDIIEVELEGTPGTRGFFTVVGVASNVPMRETQPGRYTGRVTVPSGINVNDARVLARLTAGNRESAVVQAGDPITIDAQPPQIVNLSPTSGSTITRARPDIYAEFRSQGSAGIDRNSVRLTVNGKDVTDQARVTPGFIIYTPTEPMNGSTMVQLRVADRAGNVSNALTTFNVRPVAEGLTAVTHNAEEALAPGETLTITARGEPGGTATFTLPGVAQNLPMRETSPGVYTGTYTVRSNDKAFDTPIQVRLRTDGGTVSTLNTARPVSLAGGTLQRPFLISPAPGTKLSDSIQVVGRAEPNSTVRVMLNTTGKLFGVLPLEGSEIVQDVRVGSDGVFRSDALPLPRPLGAKNLEYKVSLVTVGPDGRTSEPLSVTYGAK